MSNAELAKRVEALEKAVDELRARANGTAVPDPHRRWWEEGPAPFKDDPVWEEIVRLGREYRESLRPKPSKQLKKKHARS